ncbi:MAG: thiamine pyrophosphate-binding protein [Candidatus Eiseniibacteriota bacterium]
MTTGTKTTAGDVVAAFLERCGVDTVFGVISIHNMPILDAIGRRGKIRFVPSRGEAGGCNMADAYARVRQGLGVVVTSTGTAAGNAAGAMVEAQTAGTPLLHITGQIELPHLDRNRAYIHEAVDQLGMLRAISKAAYRVWSPETLLGTLREAVRTALTAPTGPVSIEIPIDVQEAVMAMPADLTPLAVSVSVPDPAALDDLAARLASAKRPLLWVGGGALHATKEIARLASLGFGIVTTVHARGAFDEAHPMSLGSFGASPSVEALYGTADAMLVAGSRLRGNETLRYQLKLPRPLYQIDADASAEGRAYPVERFVAGDAALALAGLADRLAGKLKVDSSFAKDIKAARTKAEAGLRDTLGPYNQLADQVAAALPRDFTWVRDITVSNSTWGNRLLTMTPESVGIYALGGGIGQGMPMAIGAALGAPRRKTVALVGDGGLYVTLGELATAVQEKADLVMLVMNDRGYGVIRNIQDAKFGSRHYFVDLHTPDFGDLARTMGWHFRRVSSLNEFPDAFAAALDAKGPAMIEIDMTAVGPFAVKFGGPPVRAGAKP